MSKIVSPVAVGSVAAAFARTSAGHERTAVQVGEDAVHLVNEVARLYVRRRAQRCDRVQRTAIDGYAARYAARLVECSDGVVGLAFSEPVGLGGRRGVLPIE